MTTQERERLEEIIREWRDHAAKILEDTKDLDWNSSMRIGLRDASFQQLSCAEHLELTLSELGDGWIPVEERLPGDFQTVLVWVPKRGHYVVLFHLHPDGNGGYEEEWMLGMSPLWKRPTHWQLLPQAPQQP